LSPGFQVSGAGCRLPVSESRYLKRDTRFSANFRRIGGSFCSPVGRVAEGNAHVVRSADSAAGI
jgi:hypothetical protein